MIDERIENVSFRRAALKTKWRRKKRRELFEWNEFKRDNETQSAIRKMIDTFSTTLHSQYLVNIGPKKSPFCKSFKVKPKPERKLNILSTCLFFRDREWKSSVLNLIVWINHSQSLFSEAYSNCNWRNFLQAKDLHVYFFV